MVRDGEVEVVAFDEVSGPVGALIAGGFDADGFDDIFVCGGASGALLIGGSGSGAVARPGAVRAASGACVGAVRVGGDIVAAVSAGGGRLALRRYAANGDGTWSLDTVLEPTDVSDEPIDTVSSTDEGATVIGERSSVIARAGTASGRFFYQLTSDSAEAVWRLDVAAPGMPITRIELGLFGSATGAGLALGLLDAEGGRVEVPLGTDTEAAWRTVTADVPAPGDGWSGRPSAIELIVRPVAPVLGGEVYVDEIVGFDADAGTHLLESFERASFVTSWAAARASMVAVMTSGAAPVLLVAPGPDGACLAEIDPTEGALVGMALDDGAPCAAVATADVDADGDGDLWIGVEGAQDRWWLNDGFGVWFDGTLTTLPVDFADARAATFADLDLDGRLDLVVANAGQSDRCYLKTSGTRFEDHTPGCGFDTASTTDIAVADVNGDGAPDIVTLDTQGVLSLRLWTGGTR